MTGPAGTAANTGATGPTGAGFSGNPTLQTLTLSNTTTSDVGALSTNAVGPNPNVTMVGTGGGTGAFPTGGAFASGRMYVFDTGNALNLNTQGCLQFIGASTGGSISFLEPATFTTRALASCDSTGSWSLFNTTSIQAPAGGPVFPTVVFSYQVPSGTAGGSAPGGGAYYTRPLNTTTGGITGASLASNIITMPAGTYQVRAQVGGLMTLSKCRLFNTGTSTVIAVGTANGDDTHMAYSQIDQNITLASPTTIAVQFYGTQSSGAQDWGRPVGAGDNEIYALVSFTKVL